MLSDALREKIRRGVQPVRRRKPLRYRRLALTAMAACLALVFGLGVAAGVISYYDRFIERMGEDLRGIVQPLGKADTQQGIRMELLAAVHDGSDAIFYLSLTDETGHRINEKTELNHIEMPGDAFVHGSQVDYDAANGTAIFRVETSTFGEELPHTAGRPLTLSLQSVLTGVTRYDALDTGLTVADITEANPEPEWCFEQPQSYGIGYGATPTVAEAMDTAIGEGTMPMLVQGSAAMDIPAPYWAKLGAAGVADGLLHLQYELVGDAGRYGQTVFYLQYPGAAQAPPYGSELASASIARGSSSTEGLREYYEYYEQVLELPAGVPPDQVRVMAYGTGSDANIRGGWEVSFILDERPAQLLSDDALGIDLNGWTVDQVALSSIGITATCHGAQRFDSDMLTMEAFLKDGTPIKTYSASISSGPGEHLVSKVCFARPVDLDDVGELRVNGQVIELHEESGQ